jgi:hypothetical protein
MNANEVIHMLVGLIYDLYPDEEYEELYGVKEKIALAQKFVDGDEYTTPKFEPAQEEE